MEENRSRATYLYNEWIVKAQRCFIIVFTLFAGWLLSFPFQGRVLFSLLESEGFNVRSFVLLILTFHLLGLIAAGFLVKDIGRAGSVIEITLLLCGILTLICLTSKGPHFFVVIPLAGFLGGICLASFGYFFHKVTPSANRFRTAADLLIASNILMVILNGATVILTSKQSLVLATLPLVFAFILMRKLIVSANNLVNENHGWIKGQRLKNSKKTSGMLPLIVLCIFIILVTINSGFMYSFITPGFSHLKIFSLWYWGVPYIVALLILRNLPRKVDRSIFLFLAISMIGLAFMGFMLLDKTPYAYFLVNTLMMGAFGIFDIFWWSILGEMLDDWDNKARVFGIGLAANVLGIIIGGSLALVISRPEIIALFVVFVCLILLPLMNQQLTKQHTSYTFFTNDNYPGEEGTDNSDNKIFINELLSLLSRREKEILPYLLEGNTNKAMAEKFSISENTVKTHIKNIYSKLEVRSRNELLHLFLDKTKN